MERLSAQWSTLWTNLGSALTQDKLNILIGLSDAIQKLAESVKQTDPEIIRNVAKAITVLAAAFAGVGIAALTGWPGIITGIGLAARDASPAFKEFTDTMAGNLLKAIQGISHAAADATGALLRSGTVARNRSQLGLMTAPSKTPFHDAHPGLPKPGVGPWDPGHFGLKPGDNLPGMHPGDLLKRSSFTGGGGGGGDKSATINNVVYLDGQAIARAVHDYMISGVEHPTQAPHFDGREGFSDVSHQPIGA